MQAHSVSFIIFWKYRTDIGWDLKNPQTQHFALFVFTHSMEGLGFIYFTATVLCKKIQAFNQLNLESIQDKIASEVLV